MNAWDDWVHPRKWGKDYISSDERLQQLYDSAEKVAKDWYASDARYYFNHHTEGYIERNAAHELKVNPLPEEELKLIKAIVHNYLPNKDLHMPLGWLRQQFGLELPIPNNGLKYVDRIVKALHNTAKVVNIQSIFDIKKSNAIEGDKDLEMLWTFVEHEVSDVHRAYEYVMNILKTLIQSQSDEKELFLSYIERLERVKEHMAEQVSARIRKAKIRLNHQPHQELLSIHSDASFFFETLDEEDRKTIRHFLLYAKHSLEPKVFMTKNATYRIRFVREQIVGKSAYKYEDVKERVFSLDIQTDNKLIESIQMIVAPELVTGSTVFSEETKPGEVFSSKVYHPKYKKMVRVKKGLYSGKYYLYLDYPKEMDTDGLLVYMNPELFQNENSNTSKKTMQIVMKLIAKVHNRKTNNTST